MRKSIFDIKLKLMKIINKIYLSFRRQALLSCLDLYKRDILNRTYFKCFLKIH